MQFSRCAPTIYFKILRPSKFTSTSRTIAADCGTKFSRTGTTS